MNDFRKMKERLKVSGERALKRHAIHKLPIVYTDFKINKTVYEYICGFKILLPDNYKEKG